MKYRDFSHLHWLWSYIPFYPVGTGGFFSLRLQQFASETDLSALFGKKVKNEWNVTSILCIPLHFYDMIFCNLENITLF